MHIEVRWPSDGDAAELARLTAAEHDRAVVLAGEGTLKRLWRIPGRRANWGLWDANDATVLHTALSSRPFYPWLTVTAHSLALRPNDPA